MKKSIITTHLFFLIFSCQYFFQLENDKNLAEKFKKEIYKENNNVYFSSLTNFDWDSLIILGPYSSIEDVEKEFKLDLTNIKQNGITYSDFYNLIVFLKNNKSIKIVEINKEFDQQRVLISKENSYFKLGPGGIIVLEE